MFSVPPPPDVHQPLPLLVVLLGVFLLARLTGDPTNLYLPSPRHREQRAEFAAENGLDQPVLTQMVDYFKGVIHLDFGASLRTGESASDDGAAGVPGDAAAGVHHHAARDRRRHRDRLLGGLPAELARRPVLQPAVHDRGQHPRLLVRHHRRVAVRGAARGAAHLRRRTARCPGSCPSRR